MNPIYNPNVPAKLTNSMLFDQKGLLENFASLYNSFALNHIPLDAVSEAGNHFKAEFPQQSAPFQTDVSEISTYAKEVTEQTTQMFLHYQGNAGQEFQLSTYQLYDIPAAGGVNLYFSFLPGNVLLYFGSFNPGGGKTFTLNLTPPVAKNIISVSACTISSVPVYQGKPTASVVKSQNNYVTQILFNSGPFGNLNPAFFLMLANL